MAIDSVFLALLVQAAKKRRESLTEPRLLSALALAHPDILVPRPLMERILGPQIMGMLKIVDPDKAEPIWRWHAMGGSKEPLYDTGSLFAALGIEATVIDIAAARGDERIVDLNETLPADLCRKFDLVIDTGTLEHCFNVAMAFRNACEALAVGGLLVHGSPLNIVNHGFWNFNPTIYPDYFEDNGFALRYMDGAAGSPATGFKQFKIEPFTRFAPPPDAGIYVIAERLRLQEQVWPVQRKYRPAKA